MVEWRGLSGPIRRCTFLNLGSTAVLAADSNGSPDGPIVTNNGSDGDVCLAHPSRIMLRPEIEEEELALRHKVLLDE